MQFNKCNKIYCIKYFKVIFFLNYFEVLIIYSKIKIVNLSFPRSPKNHHHNIYNIFKWIIQLFNKNIE